MTNMVFIQRNAPSARRVEEILGLPNDRWTNVQVSFGLEDLATTTVTLVLTGEQLVALATLAVQDVQGYMEAVEPRDAKVEVAVATTPQFVWVAWEDYYEGGALIGVTATADTAMALVDREHTEPRPDPDEGYGSGDWEEFESMTGDSNWWWRRTRDASYTVRRVEVHSE